MRAAKKTATINLVMSLCPFARMKKSESQINDFQKLHTWDFIKENLSRRSNFG